MAKKKRFPYWLTLIILVLTGTASWAVYSIINSGVADILKIFGITNAYIHGLVIIIFVLIVLVLLGFGFKKAIERIIK